MVSQPQNPNHPRPLFAAELAAPSSPDGSPVFEMGGEPVPLKDDNGANKAHPERKETNPHSQAQPWPFYLDDQGRKQPITDGAGAAPGVTKNDAVPAALAINFAGHHAGSNASTEVRPLVTRPASPPDSSSFIPAPLNISRPQQASPPPSSPKKYKPYQPPASFDEPKSPSNAGHNKHEPGLAYRPYRRPSYDESLTAAAVPTPALAPESGVPLGSPSSSPTPPAQPFGYPSSAGKEQSLAALSPGPSPRLPTASSPALGNRTPSPSSARPQYAPYHENEAENRFNNMSPPPPVPLKTRPPPPDSSVQQGHTGPEVAPPLEALHASASSPPRPPKTSTPSQPAEVVLWPHPPASVQPLSHPQSPKPLISGSSPVPSKPPTPAPVQAAAYIPDSTPIPVETTPAPDAPPSHPPPSSQPSPQPAQPSAFVPQAVYTSSTPQSAGPSSGKPSKFPQFPEVDQSIPSDPPPAYTPSATHGSGSYSVPSEKPSLFPPPPQIAPHLPQTEFPTQPAYASSHSQPTSPLPPLQSPPSPYGQAPSQPPPPQGSPFNQGAPFPTTTPSAQGQQAAQDDCLPPPGPPPSHTQYAYTPLPGQTYHVLQPPPPLPPRPNSSHGYPVVGLNSNPVNSMAYPPPPKTHYVASGPSAVGTSSSSSSQRPTGGKLFGSTVAKKWLDKTSQVLENKVEEILQNHPDPRFRPQTGTGHAPQQQQYAPQQSPASYGSVPQPQWPPPQQPHGYGGPSS